MHKVVYDKLENVKEEATKVRVTTLFAACFLDYLIKKVKLSRHRPGRPLGFPED
jgi:hypothetical protein